MTPPMVVVNQDTFLARLRRYARGLPKRIMYTIRSLADVASKLLRHGNHRLSNSQLLLRGKVGVQRQGDGTAGDVVRDGKIACRISERFAIITKQGNVMRSYRNFDASFAKLANNGIPLGRLLLRHQHNIRLKDVSRRITSNRRSYSRRPEKPIVFARLSSPGGDQCSQLAKLRPA